MRLMSTSTLAVLAALTASFITMPLAFAAPQGSRNVSFADLTMKDGSSDNSICIQRYGDGYTVTPSEAAPNRTYLSDKGHTVTLIDRSEIMGEGVHAEHDRFMMTFPDNPEEQVEVTQFVTGLNGEESYSGVFADGTCIGKVTVGPWIN